MLLHVCHFMNDICLYSQNRVQKYYKFSTYTSFSATICEKFIFFLRISEKSSTFAPDLVFAIRERRTITQELLILSGYEGARFSYTIKEIDVKRT